MMTKARLAIRKVNVDLDGPGYYLVRVAARFALSAPFR